MTEWTGTDAKAFFESTFCSPSSKTSLPIDRVLDVDEVIEGTAFHLRVEHQIHGLCSARMYRRLGELGGRLWSQEAQALLRLTARRHPALPRVYEGLVREDDEGVGLVLSESTGETLSPESVQWLRDHPDVGFRCFGLASDALRQLHSHGLVHRGIWRGAFEIVQNPGDVPPHLRLVGFEMSAFLASLVEPTRRATESEGARLRSYHRRGGDERRACLPPEAFGEDGSVSMAGHLGYGSDVFSLGVCAFQWFVGDLPVEALDEPAGTADTDRSSTAFIARLDERLAAASHLPRQLCDLLREMLSPYIRNRPTAHEVVNRLAVHHDDITASWRKNETDRPYLVTIAPERLVQFVHIEEWRNLPVDDDLRFDELKVRIERDLFNSLLIHEPNGAVGYVQGGDQESQKLSTWVLIGKIAVYFCQKFAAQRGFDRRQVDIEWALHVNYAVDRGSDQLRDIGCVPFQRRVRQVRVVHHKSSELLAEYAAGRHPSWQPLLDEVRFAYAAPDWHHPFRKGFEWWLKVQRAELDVRQYAYKRVAATAGDPWAGDRRILRLQCDAERDRSWIERGELRHVLAGLRPKRPRFGDFFDTLEDRNLSAYVIWSSDSRGHPERNRSKEARARVRRRINADEIEIEVLDREFPPPVGWLRPQDDIPSEILLERQVRACSDLYDAPLLMQALYEPYSFRGSRRPWEHVGKELEGSAKQIVRDMLAHFPFYALQGPPGTGKTTVVAHAATAYLKTTPSGRVLVASQSHYALDELATRMVGMLLWPRASAAGEHEDWRVPGTLPHEMFTCVRLAGSEGEGQVREAIRPYFDSAQAARRVDDIKARVRDLARSGEWRTPERERLLDIARQWREAGEKSVWEIQDRLWRGANVVFATCGTSTEQLLGQHSDLDMFDWVIVEEAARAWPAELVMPLVRGRRWTLIGDHKQLPPYGDREIMEIYEACRTSTRPEVRRLVDDSEPFKATLHLFERLFEREGEAPDTDADGSAAHRSRAWPVDTLDTQFRMHETIARVVSRAFYAKTPLKTFEGLCSPEPMHGLRAPGFLRSRSLAWLDTGGLESCRHEEPHWRNEGEARLVAGLLKALRPDPLTQKKLTDARLAVLSPYRHQLEALRAILPSEFHPLLHTTDSFQGREAEIVVVSLVRSNDCRGDDAALRRIGHLASEHRANVLLSRAKYLLVIVGDFKHFKETSGTPWPVVCEVVREVDGLVHSHELQGLA